MCHPRTLTELGVSVATLERWRPEARLQAVIATAAMDEAQRNAWCREKGIFCHRPPYWSLSVIGILVPVDDRRNGAGA